MNTNYDGFNNSEETSCGEFRSHFCECGKCDGNLHWDVWFGGERIKQFTAALPGIILLIEFANDGKLDKYKAMVLGQRILRRLPIRDDVFMPAEEAENVVLRTCPPMLRDIVEKIFAEFKAEQAELAKKTFGTIDGENSDGKPRLAVAVNE